MQSHKTAVDFQVYIRAHTTGVDLCLADSEMFTRLIAVQFMQRCWLSPATWNEKVWGVLEWGDQE